jgi:hypothetical protein
MAASSRREVDRLPLRERGVIERRLQGITLEDIAKVDGVTRERVRQIQKRALVRLRSYLAPRLEATLGPPLDKPEGLESGRVDEEARVVRLEARRARKAALRAAMEMPLQEAG